MNVDHMVKMANEIGAFFASESPPGQAPKDVANHLKRFWDPRMRRELLAAIDAGQAAELHPVVAEAIAAHRARLAPAATH